ncbi:MAG: DNA-binding protein WhiA [Clostridia bacterium]|nr:DNA-binding protein WhiA [Clostridia bacterium]
MSFAYDTKAELCSIPVEEDCCRKSLLSALLHVGGSLTLSHAGMGLTVTTEHPAAARLTFRLLRECCQSRAQIRTYRVERLNKGHTYELLLPPGEETRRVMLFTGLMEKTEDGTFRLRDAVPEFVTEKECCMRSYARGAFLMGGTVSDPEKSYHLEIGVSDEAYCESLRRLLAALSLPSGYTLRKGRPLLYMKGSDSIVDFLLFIGATSAFLKLENVRVNKSVRNNVNRTMNCENYNINKMMDAAQRQREDILYLERSGQFPKLSRVLRETAELRMEYPEASLEQLAEAHVPPITKSAANNRLRKISSLARDLRSRLEIAEIAPDQTIQARS